MFPIIVNKGLSVHDSLDAAHGAPVVAAADDASRVNVSPNADLQFDVDHAPYNGKRGIIEDWESEIINAGGAEPADWT
tara:strand:+ start:199 stop:432 length:234 start_codon:yes stop_codon:yes gene_type:complete